MLKTEIVKEIKELLERHWDATTIAHSLHLDIAFVQNIIHQILNT